VFYKLVNKKPVKCATGKEWVEWYEAAAQSGERIVARDEIDDSVLISTIFTGLDVETGADAPRLFETMDVPAWQVNRRGDPVRDMAAGREPAPPHGPSCRRGRTGGRRLKIGMAQTPEQLRREIAMTIVGLSDRGEISLTTIESVLLAYDAVKQKRTPKERMLEVCERYGTFSNPA
jgi:hypothetical protein